MGQIRFLACAPVVFANGCGEPSWTDASSYRPYEPGPALGDVELRSVGAATASNLMTLWAAELKRHHPEVRVEIEGNGSESALVALANGRAGFGPMDRDVRPDELTSFVAARGHEPTRLVVAIQVVGVFVHDSNPTAALTFDQLPAVFARHADGAHGSRSVTWGDLGLDGDWTVREVRPFAVHPASSSARLFRDAALDGARVAEAVEVGRGSSGVAEAVARDPAAIGFGRLAFAVPGVRAIAVGRTIETAAEPNLETARGASYPFAMPVWMALDRAPGSPPSPLEREFLRLIYSREGQAGIVVADGFVPVSPRMAAEELARAGAR